MYRYFGESLCLHYEVSHSTVGVSFCKIITYINSNILIQRWCLDILHSVNPPPKKKKQRPS